MTAARVAVVPGLVSRDADERILRRLEFDGAAGAEDVLVVVALASRQVPAEPVLVRRAAATLTRNVSVSGADALPIRSN